MLIIYKIAQIQTGLRTKPTHWYGLIADMNEAFCYLIQQGKHSSKRWVVAHGVVSPG